MPKIKRICGECGKSSKYPLLLSNDRDVEITVQEPVRKTINWQKNILAGTFNPPAVIPEITR